MVVLYRATGVLNLAFGAVGALGALVAWQLTSRSGASGSRVASVCVLSVASDAHLRDDVRVGAGRDATRWSRRPSPRSYADPARRDGPAVDVERRRSGRSLADRQHGFSVAGIQVTATRSHRPRGRDRDHGRRPRCSCAHQARHRDAGLANDREITATLGVPGRARRGRPPGSAAGCSSADSRSAAGRPRRGSTPRR